MQKQSTVSLSSIHDTGQCTVSLTSVHNTEAVSVHCISEQCTVSLSNHMIQNKKIVKKTKTLHALDVMYVIYDYDTHYDNVH